MSKVKPITPDELAEATLEYLPDRVIQAINKLIVRNANNGISEFTYPELKAAVCAGVEMGQNEAQSLGYFNFKQLYESFGWHVKVDNPDYTEGGSTRYVLSRKVVQPPPRYP